MDFSQKNFFAKNNIKASFDRRSLSSGVFLNDHQMMKKLSQGYISQPSNWGKTKTDLS